MGSSRKSTEFINPLELAILLSAFVVLLAIFSTPYSFNEVLEFWGGGLWALLSFMTQMGLILLGGYVVAVSKPVKSLLQKLVSLPRTDYQAYLFTFLIATIGCWLNWGLGLVIAAFVSIEMARKRKDLHFPLLVAVGYMGFLFWHAGLSGSIPLVVNTKKSFSAPMIGHVISLNETIFSTFNISLVLVLFASLCVMIVLFARQLHQKKTPQYLLDGSHEMDILDEPQSRLSRACHGILCVGLTAFIVQRLLSGQFSLGLNEVNLVLILLGLACQGSLFRYRTAARYGAEKLAPILIQYPLYAGIMGVMIKSDLGGQISDFFVSMSNPTTYPALMFLSAGVVNFLVPSGGGQWAVQAPIVIEGAKELGVPFWKVIMAVAWGDAWTNLAQPFWALPLLSIVGLGIQPILRYCLTALVVSGVVISLFFLFF